MRTDSVGQPRKIGDYFAWIAIATATLGGAYWGLLSCGAYVWQFNLFAIFAVTVTLLEILLPKRAGWSWTRVLMLPLVMLALYLASEALVAPFYPGPPESLQKYGERVLITLEYGPCD
jgi:hypothetical protein